MIRAIEGDPRFMELLQEKGFACELYGVLANMTWTHADGRTDGGRAFREAAVVVADLRGQGESFLHFYCSRSECVVSERVGRELARLGWTGTVMP